MKALNDIINWIINSGFLALLIYIAVAFGKPWVDSKIMHAKTAQEKEAWTLLEQVAMTAVNALVRKNMPGQEKFERAVAGVYSYLEAKGLHIDGKQIQSAVQAAYELSTLTPTVDPNAKLTTTQVTETNSATIPAGQATATDPTKGDNQ